MTRQTAIAALACVLSPFAAAAQTTIDGSGEWTVANNTSSSNGQASSNGAFSQNYALGFASSLWSPRVARFNTAGLFRTNSLTSQSEGRDRQRGHQGDIGYKLGAFVLPASSVPFFIQASRTTSASSGDLGPSNPIRSGMIAPSGAPPVDFESLNTALNVGWRLGLGSLPRAEFGYRTGETIVTGGPYRAEQRDADLSATVSKDTSRMHQALRYQRTSAETRITDTFAQQLNNLDYDFDASPGRHVRLTTHLGRRRTFVHSDIASVAPDPGSAAYVPPPSFGESSARYALAGIAYEPSGRFTVRLDGTVDRQTSGDAETRARLVTMASHVEVVRGLRLTASGTTGTRAQIVADAPVTVRTHGSVVGVTYQTSVRWLSGTVSATQGVGLNSTPDGRRGESQSWSRDASLSTRFRWLSMGGGYERAQNRDDLLDYGNLASERRRASVQADTGRVSFSATADEVHIRRGAVLGAERHAQQNLSGSASVRLQRETQITATAGTFSNRYASEAAGMGRDRTAFWGVGGQSVIWASVRMLGWVRYETAAAARTGFDQRALNGFLRLEYRLRTLWLSAEYRRTRSLTEFVALPDVDHFDGQQLRFSVLRQFGQRLR